MSQRGSAPLELALGLGMLVIPAALLVLSFGPWLEARTFVRAAAAEGARAIILADGSSGAGVGLIGEMAEARGLELAEIELCGDESCPIDRGGYVTVRVAVDVPLIDTPWGTVGGLTVEATHAEPVDLYVSLP